MSFIATAPIPSPAATLTNDGFFPDIDLLNARQTLRLDGTLTHDRLTHAITGAVLEVGNSLRAWKEKQRALGHVTLEGVPDSEHIGGVSRRVHAYFRAVYCLTKADLIERMADYDTTAAGQQRAESLQDAPEEQRRNARWAIADVLGHSRTIVELI